MKKKGNEKKNRSYGSNPLSPGEKRVGNSPKRSRTEIIHTDVINDSTKDNNSSAMKISNIDNIASQITIESPLSPASSNRRVNNRLEFINSQKKIDIFPLIVLFSWSISKP